MDCRLFQHWESHFSKNKLILSHKDLFVQVTTEYETNFDSTFKFQRYTHV